MASKTEKLSSKTERLSSKTERLSSKTEIRQRVKARISTPNESNE